MATQRVWVTVASYANRSGAPLHAHVVAFVKRVAILYGRALVISCGTNHNRYVKGSQPPRESQHWKGNAADVPASGTALTRLGQTALIAAGARPAWAHRQTGGAYNVNGVNILFNTNIGGNHFNHLHAGLLALPPLRGSPPEASSEHSAPAPAPAGSPKALPKKTLDEAWHDLNDSRYGAPRHARGRLASSRDALKKGVK